MSWQTKNKTNISKFKNKIENVTLSLLNIRLFRNKGKDVCLDYSSFFLCAKFELTISPIQTKYKTYKM